MEVQEVKKKLEGCACAKHKADHPHQLYHHGSAVLVDFLSVLKLNCSFLTTLQATANIKTFTL